MHVLRLLILAFTVLATTAPAATVDREYAARAAFIFNILKFTYLPVSELRDHETGLVLCVLEDRGMFRALRTITGRPARGGNLSVTEIDGLDDMVMCNAVFVGTRWSGSRETLYAHAERHRVLTLSEQSQEVEKGMMIGIVPSGSRLGIEINVPATRAAGIRFSAELLQLSRLVGADSSGVVQEGR